MKAKRGFLIVLEGIDGTGKSTQSVLLGKWLEQQGYPVILSREPTAGKWGKMVRDSATSGRLSLEDELQYFLEDRKEHVTQLIAPALEAGKIVILDRYYFSNMAYQGARGLDPAEIRQRNEEFAIPPDLMVIFDLDVGVALSRIGARGDIANQFEQRENLQRCRKIFLSLRTEKFSHLMDAGMKTEQFAQELRNVISALLLKE